MIDIWFSFDEEKQLMKKKLKKRTEWEEKYGCQANLIDEQTQVFKIQIYFSGLKDSHIIVSEINI